MDKAEYGNEKSAKNQSRRRTHLKSNLVNPLTLKKLKNYYTCLAASGNTFPEPRDNIQGYVSAAAINYNQGNSVYRPPGLGSLPSNIVANPKGELKAITTRSGLVLDGPTVPTPPIFINPEKMLKALLSNKEKLQELANTPLNKNCSSVILKKLPEKLRDPRKFLIPCGFSELKCKALADLGASINLIPFSVWKKLGLPELIFTRMTLELANRAICTPAGIARDVFVPVGKFTFPADFVIFDYKSDPRVPLILGRPFLRTAHALIDVHGEDMILRDGVRDELTLITFPPEYDDDLQFDIESDLKEIEYLLHHDPIKDIDSSLMDSIDQSNLADLDNNLVDSMPEMFPDEHALDYSSPPIFDEYDDDLFEVEVDALPSTNNEDKVFNPCILIQENLFEIITRVVQDKKLAISNASLILEDFNPPLYEPLFFKEVPRSNMLLPFSSENEKKVFKLGIHTSEKVHSSLIPELSHQGYKVFKINQVFKSSIRFFFSPVERTPISWLFLVFTFIPLINSSMGELGQVK
nr:reverse transcriptase domain-containing protein [Tanacetum cinerariifolium]